MFSTSRKFDFPPELKFSDQTNVQITSEKTLLGVIITDDLKWKRNTEYIVSKARRKIWILRRLLHLDLSIFDLFNVYTKEIRSLLEFAVPVWHSSLTRKQSTSIEAVQKLAFRIILRNRYTDYFHACATFETETLEQRRHKLCINFAKKNVKSEHCLFTFPTHTVNLRQRKQKVNEFKFNTRRFQRSSLPFLASLLNSNM